MFKGWFLINDCIKVSYKEVPVGRIKFTVEHVGIERPKFEILIRLMGDIPVTVTAKGFDYWAKPYSCRRFPHDLSEIEAHSL